MEEKIKLFGVLNTFEVLRIIKISMGQSHTNILTLYGSFNSVEFIYFKDDKNNIIDIYQDFNPYRRKEGKKYSLEVEDLKDLIESRGINKKYGPLY